MIIQNDLYEMLDKMRERPGMYLGGTSITLMGAYIDGFRAANNYETSETPSFDNFNDFVGNFYGKHTTAGWKNLILADHFGNEIEALTRFYVLLDEYRADPKLPESRAIICRFLSVGLQDLVDEKGHEKSQIAALLQPITSQLYTAIYGGISVWYDTILQDIFDLAKGNKYLHDWIKKHAPTTVFYEYELWHGSNGKETNTTLIPSNRKQKAAVLNDFEVLVDTFFAINEDKAKAVKEDFLDNLSQQ
jgi:hypothetical protein